jgi:hypothetical protein
MNSSGFMMQWESKTTYSADLYIKKTRKIQIFLTEFRKHFVIPQVTRLILYKILLQLASKTTYSAKPARCVKKSNTKSRSSYQSLENM